MVPAEKTLRVNIDKNELKGFCAFIVFIIFYANTSLMLKLVINLQIQDLKDTMSVSHFSSFKLANQAHATTNLL